MHTSSIVSLSLAAAAWLTCALAAEDLSVPPPIAVDAAGEAPAARRTEQPTGVCGNCAVIRSIRQVQREGAADEVPGYIASPQYLDSRRYSEPHVGPVFGITFGQGQTTQTFVGAAGAEAIRRRILRLNYEVSLRFDDGRVGLIEVLDVGDLRVGDRVRVDGPRLEKVRD